MARTRKPMTAAEHEALLANDESYQLMKRERDAEFARRELELRMAEEPIVKDLAAVGRKVESVWDLVNTTESYPEAVPILVRHLRGDYPDRILEGIARALVVPESGGRFTELVDAFSETKDANLQWALHLAIAAAARSEHLDTLVTLVRDPVFGRNRVMFAARLARDQRRGRVTLVDLQDDPDIGRDVVRVLSGKPFGEN